MGVCYLKILEKYSAVKMVIFQENSVQHVGDLIKIFCKNGDIYNKSKQSLGVFQIDVTIYIL